MPTTIIEFLEARIAEDEVIGKRIVDEPHHGHRGHLQNIVGVINRNCPDCMTIVAGKRWLAECAAKRAIIELHTCQCPDPDCKDCGACSGGHHADPTPFPCDTIKAVAAIHSDHPDFDQAWA